MNLTFPDLPVSRHRDTISAALRDHQVVIVCGDTGSGKTTQLPKIALELGRGQNAKRIGCTQPRRLAATSVAKRVASELKVELGQEVGYQIRFDDRTSKDTRVKFMTDGVLLAETRADQTLRQYDTLIIDEAHERSLNIDFILGYLHRLLPQRPDLKILISSATLDAGTFAEFFASRNGDPAPVISVEGRTFPVEDRYLPPTHYGERLADHVARAAEELAREDPTGDTLVFLPGEREITDCANMLDGRRYPRTRILPLFARQAGNDQQAVFKPTPGTRRIILATNVAETSLTIPDIRSVIDSGIARMSRFDATSGIQRLQIEPVSQASARQRRGRCGRIAPGICIRLYDQEDFENRKEFTDPEILRSNLTGVVLQMEHLDLGDPLKFPFVDPPQPKRITQAYRTLEEIGAITSTRKDRSLTAIGNTLARLPLDPRIGRILIAAAEEECIPEALVIASALTIQDPRERPQDKRTQADQAHAKFRDKQSDFTTWLLWWHAAQEAKQSSNNALRKFCQTNFANYRRLQEWFNLHRELKNTLRDLKWKGVPKTNQLDTDPAGTYHQPLHRSILTAIPSHIGMHQRDKQGKGNGYKGAKDKHFFLFPGSGLSGTAPPWIMAFERVETAKLYARNASLIDPAIIEEVAPHLCTYRYTEPQWDPQQGAVYGKQHVLAFGLPIIPGRPIHFGRIDPATARDIFILEALVNGNTKAPLKALEHNRATEQEAQRLEHKLRRRDGLMHPAMASDFYREKVPKEICTQKAFEKWADQQPPETLSFTLEDCIVPQLEPIQHANYPDELICEELDTIYHITYLHDPAHEADGITCHLPLADLPHLPAHFGDRLVEGWYEEKIEALHRCLPKESRRLNPLRDLVESNPHAPLENSLGLNPESLNYDRLPTHLRMRFEIYDDKQTFIGAGRNLQKLQKELAGEVKARFTKISHGKFEKRQVTTWDFGDLPESAPIDRHTTGYPALAASKDLHPILQLFPAKGCANTHHPLGIAALYRHQHPEKIAQLEHILFTPKASAPKAGKKSKPQPQGFASLAEAFGPKRNGRAPALSSPQQPGTTSLAPQHLRLLDTIGKQPTRNRQDLITQILTTTLGSPKTQSEYEAAKKSDIFETAAKTCHHLTQLLESAQQTIRFLDHPPKNTDPTSLADARWHLDWLLMPAWLLDPSLQQRAKDHQGLLHRLQTLAAAPAQKDLDKINRYRQQSPQIWAPPLTCVCTTCPLPAPLQQARTNDFKLRLHTFAQTLK